MKVDWTPVSGGRPIVLGHRGTSSTGTENTLPSFEAALREGAAGIEFDVRLDANGRVVVHHDASLRRLTQGADTRKVEDIGSRELDTIRLPGNERIPSVVDVLEWAESRSAFLNIELKSNLRQPATLVVTLLEALRRTRTSVPLLLSSFDPRLVAKLAQLRPNLPLGFLVENPSYSDWRERSWLRLGADAVCSESVLLTPERIGRWISDGALLVAWTVNDRRRALDLGARGVHVVVSDTPSVLAAQSNPPNPGPLDDDLSTETVDAPDPTQRE